jgi:hypothetical protein
MSPPSGERIPFGDDYNRRCGARACGWCCADRCRKRQGPAVKDLTTEQKAQLAYDLNDARCHLSGADRKKIKKEQPQRIAEALLAHPEKSNRQIQEEVGAGSHNTVQAVREELVSTGQIAQLEETVGKDGKARTTTPKRSEPARDREPGEDDDDVFDQRDEDRDRKKREENKRKPPAKDAIGQKIPAADAYQRSSPTEGRSPFTTTEVGSPRSQRGFGVHNSALRWPELVRPATY